MRIKTILLGGIVSCCMCQPMAYATGIDIVPQPMEVTLGEGVFVLPQKIGVAYSGKESIFLAKSASHYLEMSGQTSEVVRRGAVLTVELCPDFSEEEYTLKVTDAGIHIGASCDKGVFYAVQTLVQLMLSQKDRSLPLCNIVDRPRMGYRGLMLDVVRCYIPPQEIKRFIDVASRLKINNVHLHLTDDNGWRLEIKKYPKLTDVGAWRVYRPELFPGRLNQRDPQEATPVGGFYTQKQMRDIVRYAAERHINIVPEIEMPAHSAAAIASYPEFACTSNDRFVGVFPGIGGKDASIIMCAGNDDVYRFYEDVLDEVMEIFPSKMIHLGGDEADKRLWENCELCRKRLADEGLENFEELQGYFMDRINRYVRSKGRTAIGWDEVTYGDPKEDMVIMGWQGDGSVAVDDSRRSGRKFIMTPAQTTYLIRYQGPQWFEPWTYFGNNTISDIYGYDPVGEDWTGPLEENLLGVQGSLWSEFCDSAADMQYLVFPRLLAVADIGWRAKGTSDIQSFFRAVDNFIPVLDSLGVSHALSMWNIQHKVRPQGDGSVAVDLRCERPDAQILYSFADSTFSDSNIFDKEIILDHDTVLYASTFRDGMKMGKTLVLPLEFNKATGRKVEASARNGLGEVLINGVRGSKRNSDFEWAGWWNGEASFTVDLGSVQPIDSVSLGMLVNSDICIGASPALYLYVSDNGKSYRLAGEYHVGKDMMWTHPAHVLDVDFGSLDTQGRYIRITAISPGAVPDGMAREGTPSWIYFDEISVR